MTLAGTPQTLAQIGEALKLSRNGFVRSKPAPCSNCDNPNDRSKVRDYIQGLDSLKPGSEHQDANSHSLPDMVTN